MVRAASMAQRNSGNNFNPPPYSPPSSGIFHTFNTNLIWIIDFLLGILAWYAAPPPAYTPNPTNYGWIPQSAAFPDQPPQNGVFVCFIPTSLTKLASI
jgi:hypothetical protein